MVLLRASHRGDFIDVSMLIIASVRSRTYELGDLNFCGVPFPELSSVRGVSGMMKGLTLGVAALIIWEVWWGFPPSEWCCLLLT